MRRTLRILIALWWSFPLAALPQLAMANSTDAIQLRFPGSRPVAPVADGPGRFRLPNLYPGVDAVFYSENSVAEYDFVIAPRADLSKILIGFENAEILKINQSGDIELRSARLYAQHRRPYAYQWIHGRKTQIACRYTFASASVVRFELAS